MPTSIHSYAKPDTVLLLDIAAGNDEVDYSQSRTNLTNNTSARSHQLATVRSPEPQRTRESTWSRPAGPRRAVHLFSRRPKRVVLVADDGRPFQALRDWAALKQALWVSSADYLVVCNAGRRPLISRTPSKESV